MFTSVLEGNGLKTHCDTQNTSVCQDADFRALTKLAYRQAHAVPALEELHAWLMDKYQSIRLPSSPIRKAAEYALSRWDRLVRYA